MQETPKIEKFSYSKLGVFEQCPFKYHLIYREKHFIHDDSLATDFGTLIHYIEETMAKRLTTTFKLDQNDYKELIDLLYNVNDDKEKVYGVNILKTKWSEAWNTPDKNGTTYDQKIEFYETKGIYRLRQFLIDNPDLEIIAIEKEFNLEYDGVIFHGFIDRCYRDTSTGEIILEDIKTWKEPLDSEKTEFKTPLQFVIYNMACQELFNIPDNMIRIVYELVLIDQKQYVGTKGYLKRGMKKLSQLLSEIKEGCMIPEPQVLCHWCQFCNHNPNAPEEAKNLCPYYSKWTPEHKIIPTSEVEYEWMGPENHEAIMKQFAIGSKLENELKATVIINVPKVIEVKDVSRHFLGRR